MVSPLLFFLEFRKCSLLYAAYMYIAMFVSLLKDAIGYPKKEGHRACGVSLLK